MFKRLIEHVSDRLIGKVPSGHKRSPQWQETKRKHLLVDGSCKACGSSKALEVHHIMPFHLEPKLELEASNLITLCRVCHFVFGHFKDYRRFNEAVRDDVARYFKRRLEELKNKL